MALVEAVLTYRPHGIGSSGAVPLGTTADPKVLRALRDSVLEQAQREALMWRAVDPGLYAMKAAEFERLSRVFNLILPEEDLRPELRLVRLEAGGSREDELRKDPTATCGRRRATAKDGKDVGSTHEG